jgi:hypothetical protein
MGGAIDVETGELRGALESTLREHFDPRRRIVALVRRPSDYGSSFTIEELHVRLDDGTPLELMFKNLSRRALLEPARRLRPDFLDDPQREIDVYRVILAASGLDTAACYGAIVDRPGDRYWLFLEKVPGVRLAQVGEFSIWRQVARWLAAMHARLAERRAALRHADGLSLLAYDADFYRRWMRRALTFARQRDPSGTSDACAGLEWLAARYDRVVERLTALPITWIHGELYAANVLVHATAGRLRVCPVDWETAAVGPALMDLAALTAGGWSDTERTSLALAYHDASAGLGEYSSPDEFLAALDGCYLHLAVQWLGWSEAWSPPPSQAQDWLGVALRVARRLEL